MKRLGQISPVTEIGGKPRNLSPVKKSTRKQSEDSFGEYDTVFEGTESFEARVGTEDTGIDTNEVFDVEADADNASGRRTEIATGIYFISRKKIEPGS